MAKVCKSCGKEYKGEFCEHCGYGDPNLKTHAADKYKTQKPVRYMTPDEKEEYYYELKKKEEQRRRKGGKKERDPKQVRLLIVAAAALCVLIFGTLFGSGVLGFNERSTDVVEKYFKAINDRDFDKYASTFPPEIHKSIEQDLKETGYSEAQYMDAYCSDFTAEYGSDMKIEYNILKTEPMTEYSMTDYKAAYGSVPNISEVENVIMDVTFNGSQGKETFRMNAYVGKVGRHWKMFNLEYDPGTITPDMVIDETDGESNTEPEE